MSFASEAKAELCRVKRKTKVLRRGRGLRRGLLYCNSFTPREIRIITGSAEFVELLPRLFRQRLRRELRQACRSRSASGSRQTLLMTDGGKIATVFRAFGMEPDDTLTLHINLGVLENDCCRASFRARRLPGRAGA